MAPVCAQLNHWEGRNMRRFSLLSLLVGFCLATWFLTARALVQEDYAISPGAAEPGSQLVVTPLALGAQLPVGEEDLQHLFVGNAGMTATLNYTISLHLSGHLAGIIDWLEVGPLHGTLASNTQVPVDVTFIPQSYMEIGSLWNASLVVDSDALVAPTVITVPLHLEVVEPVVKPVVAPLALSAALPVGETACHTLTLGNEGNATLIFALALPAEPSIQAVPWLSLSPSSGLVPPGGSRVISATFDTARTSTGFYATRLTIDNNSQLTPSITVPISLTVEAARLYLPLMSKSYQPTQSVEK
jgi:hypothetical protein